MSLLTLGVGKAVTAAGTATAWNAGTSSANYTISGGGLVATHTVTGADDLVRANNGHSGTGDWSFTVVPSATGNPLVGLANASEATTGNFCGATNNSIGWFQSDGNLYRNGSSIASPGAFADGNTLTIRLRNNKLYLGKDTGSGNVWVLGDPVAETGGIDCSTMGTLFPAASVNGAKVLTANFTNWP
jgi:hypothetical protein